MGGMGSVAAGSIVNGETVFRRSSTSWPYVCAAGGFVIRTETGVRDVFPLRTSQLDGLRRSVLASTTQRKTSLLPDGSCPSECRRHALASGDEFHRGSSPRNLQLQRLAGTVIRFQHPSADARDDRAMPAHTTAAPAPFACWHNSACAAISRARCGWASKTSCGLRRQAVGIRLEQFHSLSLQSLASQGPFVSLWADFILAGDQPFALMSSTTDATVARTARPPGRRHRSMPPRKRRRPVERRHNKRKPVSPRPLRASSANAWRWDSGGPS